MDRTLIVAALPEELNHTQTVHGAPVIFTGIGKYAPTNLINFGAAGRRTTGRSRCHSL
jgi:hypothetical protein